jgi:chaperonin GroES
MSAATTNLIPLEYNVFVELDPTEEKTQGGIILPGQKVERNRLEETEGTLVAMSPLAFSYDDWPADAYRPQIGNRVLFARYAGVLTERDGKWLRIVKDKDLIAVEPSRPELAAAA